jgi:hypothetical protein
MTKESKDFTPYVPDYKGTAGGKSSLDVHHEEVLRKLKEREEDDRPLLNDQNPPRPLSEKGKLSDMQWSKD